MHMEPNSIVDSSWKVLEFEKHVKTRTKRFRKWENQAKTHIRSTLNIKHHNQD